MTLRDTAYLLILAAIWGASFAFVRLTAPTLGAFFVADSRVLMAGMFLGLFGIARRVIRLRSVAWRSYLVLGLFNAALQFGLMAFAATQLSAAVTAILVATMPLWSALMALVFWDERLSRGQVVGLAASYGGVAIVVSGSPFNVASVLAILAGLGSAMAGAIGGIYAQSTTIKAHPLEKTVGQQLAAGIILLPGALLDMPGRMPNVDEILALLALAVLSTGLAFLIYFKLIEAIGATRALTVEFLVPVFAAVWAWLLLGETIAIETIFGGVVVLVGTCLVNQVQIGINWVKFFGR